jgi:hypothetical protein
LLELFVLPAEIAADIEGRLSRVTYEKGAVIFLRGGCRAPEIVEAAVPSRFSGVVDLTRYAMKRGIVGQSTGLPRFFVSETSIRSDWELS